MERSIQNQELHAGVRCISQQAQQGLTSGGHVWWAPGKTKERSPGLCARMCSETWRLAGLGQPSCLLV